VAPHKWPAPFSTPRPPSCRPFPDRLPALRRSLRSPQPLARFRGTELRAGQRPRRLRPASGLREYRNAERALLASRCQRPPRTNRPGPDAAAPPVNPSPRQVRSGSSKMRAAGRRRMQKTAPPDATCLISAGGAHRWRRAKTGSRADGHEEVLRIFHWRSASSIGGAKKAAAWPSLPATRDNRGSARCGLGTAKPRNGLSGPATGK
jgi:hypothetical protein